MTVGLFWTLFAGFILGLLMNAFHPMRLATGLKALLLACGIGMLGALAVSFTGQGLKLWDQEAMGAFFGALAGAGVLLVVSRYVVGGPVAPPAAVAA
ncbi:hypothetical protein GN316_02420 [Xylophilus sp. Kf1]|nr:hypothetical protein [Xylophilus sp. Kf1]